MVLLIAMLAYASSAIFSEMLSLETVDADTMPLHKVETLLRRQSSENITLEQRVSVLAGNAFDDVFRSCNVGKGTLPRRLSIHNGE